MVTIIGEVCYHILYRVHQRFVYLESNTEKRLLESRWRVDFSFPSTLYQILRINKKEEEMTYGKQIEFTIISVQGTVLGTLAGCANLVI